MFKRWDVATGFITVLLCGLLTSPTHAQTHADEIKRVDAQIELQQKQRQLNDMLGDDPVIAKLPQVVAVMAFGGEMKARLMLKSGVALTYGEDEVINQRMRVVAITPREVVVAITPAAGSRGAKLAKGKKTPDPVLMPLEFMSGAQQQGQQNGLMGQASGMPGAPGAPVQSSPIPEALRQQPPVVQGATVSSWPSSALAAEAPAAK